MAGAAPSAAPSARRSAAAASSRRRSPGPGSPEWRVPRPMTAPAAPGGGSGTVTGPPGAAAAPRPGVRSAPLPAAEPCRAGPPRSRLSREISPAPRTGNYSDVTGGGRGQPPPHPHPEGSGAEPRARHHGTGKARGRRGDTGCPGKDLPGDARTDGLGSAIHVNTG